MEEKPMNKEEFNIRIIDELSGVRGDIREVMTTMKHISDRIERTNDDMKEIKGIANKASSEAEAASNKAKRALEEAEERKGELQQMKKEQASQQKEQRTIRRWGIALSVSIGMPFLGIIVTVIIFMLGG